MKGAVSLWVYVRACVWVWTHVQVKGGGSCESAGVEDQGIRLCSMKCTG